MSAVLNCKFACFQDVFLGGGDFFDSLPADVPKLKWTSESVEAGVTKTLLPPPLALTAPFQCPKSAKACSEIDMFFHPLKRKKLHNIKTDWCYFEILGFYYTAV